MDARYRSVCRFWTPNTAYTGLAQHYVEDPDLRASHGWVAHARAEPD